MAQVATETATRAAAQKSHDAILAVYRTAINYVTHTAFSLSFGAEPATYDYAVACAITGQGAARPAHVRCLQAIQDYLQGKQDYAAMRAEVRYMIQHLYTCGNSQYAAADYLETLWAPVEQAHVTDTGYIN